MGGKPICSEEDTANSANTGAAVIRRPLSLLNKARFRNRLERMKSGRSPWQD